MASFTQEQLTALEAAIASGTRRVKYADKEVEYTSLTDMLRARELMRRALGLTDSTAARIYPTAKKGFSE